MAFNPSPSFLFPLLPLLVFVFGFSTFLYPVIDCVAFATSVSPTQPFNLYSRFVDIFTVPNALGWRLTYSSFVGTSGAANGLGTAAQFFD